MIIIQINISVNSGSHGQIAEEIGSAAIKAGHMSIIAAAYTNRTSLSEVIKIGNSVDRNLHGLGTRMLDRHGFGSSISTKILVDKIRKIDPDLIHLHNIHGYYLHIGVLFDFLKSLNKPVIWTLHDCWPFTGHCSHFQDVNCEKWKSQCHHCPLTGGYPTSWSIDNSYSNYIKKKKLFTGLQHLVIVSPSEWLAENLRNSFLSSYEIKVINNGTDLEKFRPINSDGIRNKYNLSKKYILGVANIWNRKKGLNDFIKLRVLLDRDTEIVLVGLSNSQIRSLPEGIRGLTRTESTEELAAMYSGAEAFVNPTYVDNFPSVNIEALACGTPVVTYKTGGSPEAIDEKTGFVLNKGDIRGLAETLNWLLAEHTKAYSRECRARAEKLYDSKDMASRYLSLYQSLING